jgi:hypothetical protein
MSEAKTNVRVAKLEWHSIDETPPLQTVEYAGEIWLQSSPLLLANAAGKMAVGYCQQETDGQPEFEVGAGTQNLKNISLWAIVEPPRQKPKKS